MRDREWENFLAVLLAKESPTTTTTNQSPVRAAAVRLDAEMLIEHYGELAFKEARSRARVAQLGKNTDGLTSRHWDRVAAVVAADTRRHIQRTIAAN
jgi:hypothetical protein